MAYKLGDIIEFQTDNLFLNKILYQKGDVGIVCKESSLESSYLPIKDKDFKEMIKLIHSISKRHGREMVKTLGGYSFYLARNPKCYKKIGNIKKDISKLLEDL